MDKGKIFVGLFGLTLIGAIIGYLFASAWLTFRSQGIGAHVDLTWIAKNYFLLRDYRPADFQRVNFVIAFFAGAGFVVAALLTGTALTKFGETHWQKVAELKRNGFFGKPGSGFIVGKMGRSKGRGRLLSSTVYPHALVVAPTGRGKTSGFVIPNLLTFNGSVVVLDVKGENFEKTARHRASQGDKVFRFAPTDWHDRRTHRYNPLLRIAELKDPDRQQMELQLLASLFLQSDSDRTQGLLKGGIDLFVAAGLLAFERGRPTLGEIYRISSSGGQKQKEFMARRDEVKNPAAKLIFERLASTNNDTLTSYLSLLMTSGLDQWSNPAIDKATQVSDFDFRDIRKAPVSVYLVVQPMMVKPLAALIRLFFSDLLSAMQDKEPGPDEPWPVMIMLDEFNRLGKMPIVVESIETLRSYRGHLAIVTQTIPALDEIYGENTRRALQGNAGIKVYLTPSDEKTVEELSKAVGKTTKRVVTRSRAINKNPFEGRSVSERTEETSLLTEDEARRLPLDDIVLVIDAQMPVRAKRIKYFEDPFFKSIHDAQSGELPFPETTIKSSNAATPELDNQQAESEAKPKEETATATQTPQPMPESVSGSGSGVKAEAAAQSIAQAAAAPHQERVVMSKRKRRASKAVEKARRQDDDRQRELDLSLQQQLDLPAVTEATEADLQALRAADESLAELEATLAAEQGGVTDAA